VALQSRGELEEVLRTPAALGRVFARHAYGMRRWVDLFAARIPATDDPGMKELLAGIVADNARHAVLFRRRALAHGVDPQTYACPPEGERIYDRIPDLADDEALAYALGSLEHFSELLAVYAAAARDGDAAGVESVRADTARTLARLWPLVDATAAHLVREAHERYRRRELIETPLYRDAA
jgi:hypothetical protein